jgi:flagellar biosynthesis protein FlhG
MNDQAQELRQMVNNVIASQDPNRKQTKVITVTSGKGGVGKSNFTLNFALILQSYGYKVLIFDADIGFANIDVLMGMTPQYNLHHMLKREKTIWEIINVGHNNLQFIGGGSGFQDLIRLSESEVEYFVSQVNQLNGHVDFIIFDTGAGLSKETLRFIIAANETIVLTTPEPTSVMDAYSIIKMVRAMNYKIKFQLVVNRVADAKEGKQTADKISMVCQRFLNIELPVLGYVLDDHNVTKAVKKQVPFSLAFPNSEATRGVSSIVQRFVAGQTASPEPEPENNGIKGFLGKMMKLLKQ